MQSRHRAAAGFLLMAAGVLVLMGIITAEALYPASYSTHANEVSDLGSTRPPDPVIYQPSSGIFTGTMLTAGALIIGGAYFLHRGLGDLRATIPVLLLGIGVLGVGVFPGNRAVMHPIVALVAFLSGGLAAVLTASVQRGIYRYVSIALGVVALAALAVGLFGTTTLVFEELGVGGVERWIVYPVVLWTISFGAYLLGAAE
jgi:hypothetical membrane protein